MATLLDMFLNVKPHPKGRPRFSNGKIFTPKETQNAERDINLLVVYHMEDRNLHISEKPICLEMIFYFGAQIKHDEFVYHTDLPDLDNCVKTVCDALNGIVYYDDRQVARIVCEKRFGRTEGIQLIVKELDGN
jgi:Holliday junction resolvase RusA-like endonuclease